MVVNDLDKLLYPRYDESQKELKYVYDTELCKHIINNKQCCYYSPVSQHETCPNKNDCIFHREIWEYYDETLHETVSMIKTIRKIMKDYEYILNEYINGNIIYHETLDDCYDIHIFRDENDKLKTSVTVESNFKNIVKTRLNNLKLDLRDLNRELFNLKRKR